jgi:hypothetical protein
MHAQRKKTKRFQLAELFPGTFFWRFTLPCMENRTDSDIRAAREERRAIQAIDGKKAMAEYLAVEEATRANTERLRKLRLAREQ